VGIVSFFLPAVIPVLGWGEDFFTSVYFVALTRYMLVLHGTWLVNSAAHLYGNKPYDRFINPSENWLVAMLAIGEGWHNYHHVFPWDYKTAELGNYRLNWTTAFIDLMAKFGLAYDLKTVDHNVVRMRVLRTGDGTHPEFVSEQKTDENQNSHSANIWGWGDTDMTNIDYSARLVKTEQNQRDTVECKSD